MSSPPEGRLGLRVALAGLSILPSLFIAGLLRPCGPFGFGKSRHWDHIPFPRPYRRSWKNQRHYNRSAHRPSSRAAIHYWSLRDLALPCLPAAPTLQPTPRRPLPTGTLLAPAFPHTVLP